MNTSNTSRTHTEVLIVGTGFSGLGMAVSLKRQGQRDFLLLERADDVGGTWRDNSYPGAACDIQSHLYSFSFRPNPNWTYAYSRQPEIWQYLRDVADEERLLEHVHFGANMTRAVWDAAQSVWQVDTPVGQFQAPVLVTATGPLSDPAYPDIAGLHTFEGKLLHSAQWDRTVALEGKRIGVIGTGSSSIQMVPELAKLAQHLTVFQRTPPYVVPRRDRVFSQAEKAMFARFPDMARELREDIFWFNETGVPQRRMEPTFTAQLTGIALQHLHAQVPDEALRKKLTPNYIIGCKRILLSNDYYPALQQANVTLETAGIAHVDAQGVVLKNGERVDLDILIVATGFEVTDLPIAKVIYGEKGLCLADRWRDGGQALDSIAVTGFPNLFMMLGPNSGLGTGSMVYMIETQIQYIQQAVDFMFARAAVLNPDPVAQQRYVDDMQQRSAGTVYTAGGCSSWYLHKGSGKLTTLWPDFMTQFRLENGTFIPEKYQVAEGVMQAVRGA